MEPVATPSGYLYCRECILAILLAQREALAGAQATFEAEAAADAAEAAGAVADAADAAALTADGSTAVDAEAAWAAMRDAEADRPEDDGAEDALPTAATVAVDPASEEHLAVVAVVSRLFSEAVASATVRSVQASLVAEGLPRAGDIGWVVSHLLAMHEADKVMLDLDAGVVYIV